MIRASDLASPPCKGCLVSDIWLRLHLHTSPSPVTPSPLSLSPYIPRLFDQSRCCSPSSPSSSSPPQRTVRPSDCPTASKANADADASSCPQHPLSKHQHCVVQEQHGRSELDSHEPIDGHVLLPNLLGELGFGVVGDQSELG